MTEALIEMSRKGFGVVGVVDGAGALVGIVTDGDLRRHMDGLLERRVDGGDDPRAADHRHDGAGLRGAGGDERAQDHHALRHGARGRRRGRRGSCTSTTACAPAWSDAMANGPGAAFAGRGVLKLGLPLVAVGLLAALFLVQTDDTIGGEVRLLPGRRRRARRAASASPTRPSPAPPRATTASASPPTRCCPTPRRRSGRRSPGSPARSSCKDGPVVTLEAATGDLHIPTQRLDMTGAVTITTSDGYRMRRRQGDARPQGRHAGRRRRGGDARGPLGQITSRQPAGRAGGGERGGAAVLFRKRRPADIRSAGHLSEDDGCAGVWRCC